MSDSSYFLIALKVVRDASARIRKQNTLKEEAEGRIVQEKLQERRTLEIKSAKTAEAEKDRYYHKLRQEGLYSIAMEHLQGYEKYPNPKHFPKLDDLEKRLRSYKSSDGDREIRKNISDRINVLRQSWQAPYAKLDQEEQEINRKALEEWRQSGGEKRELQASIQALTSAIKIDRSLVKKIKKPNYWTIRKGLYLKHGLDKMLLAYETHELEAELQSKLSYAQSLQD